MGWGATLSAPDVDLDMAFETYLWPYGNALVTVDFTSDVRELDSPTVRNQLSIIQGRVEAQTPPDIGPWTRRDLMSPGGTMASHGRTPPLRRSRSP